jgi:hypothetical protein
MFPSNKYLIYSYTVFMARDCFPNSVDIPIIIRDEKVRDFGMLNKIIPLILVKWKFLHASPSNGNL